MSRMRPGLLVVLLVLSACAAGGGTASRAPDGSPGDSPDPTASPPGSDGGETGGIEHPTGDEPILVVDSAGGFMIPNASLTMLPSFVLLGDGRVVVQGMTTLEFPGPLLPPLMERRLTEAGIQEVLRGIESTNLFTGDLELRGMQNMVADASDTIFRLRAGGLESEVTVYALEMLMPDMEPPPGMDAAEVEAHETLSTLHGRLLSLDSWLPAEAWATDEWVAYGPEAVRLYVRDVTDEPLDGDLAGQVREWPVDADPATIGEEVALTGDGTRCVAVEGADAETWLAELAEANQNTRWTTGDDRRFSVAPRPLLPYEDVACPEASAGS